MSLQPSMLHAIPSSSMADAFPTGSVDGCDSQNTTGEINDTKYSI